MSNSTAYGMIFREFQYFAGEESIENLGQGAGTPDMSYAISTRGDKILVIDSRNQMLYLLTGPLGDEELNPDINYVKNAALSGLLSTREFTSLAANKKGFYWSIDLKRDPIYKQALANNPNFNEDVPNIGFWIGELAETARQLLTTNKLPRDLFTAVGFSHAATTYLTNETMGDDGANVLSVASGNIIDNSLMVDGQGGSDFLTFRTELASLMNGGVRVDLALNLIQFALKSGQTVNGSIFNVEGVIGTSSADVLRGSTSLDFFTPGGGADEVYGNRGGHVGSLTNKDRVTYWDSSNTTKGISVRADVILYGDNLQEEARWVPIARVKDFSGATDLLYDISYVVGTMQNDTYIGDPGQSSNAYSKASAIEKSIGGTIEYFGEFAGLAGADVLRGNVRASYTFDPSGVSVNTTGKAVLNAQKVSVAPGTARDGFGTIDKLFDVTRFRGSEYDDFFMLGNANDIVTGEGGDDFISGGRGNDNLWGTSGSDVIVGGAGLDIMFGDLQKNSVFSTREPDTFVFLSVRDAAGSSAVVGEAYLYGDNDGEAIPVRVGDIVADFQVGIDKLDLSAIDANTQKRGNQAFALYDESQKPGVIAVLDGQLQLSYSQSDKGKYYNWTGNFQLDSNDEPTTAKGGAYVVGDVNGDGKIDFSIFLLGVSRDELLSSEGWLVA